MPYLIIARDGDAETRVELTAATVRIGRDPGNDVALADSTKWVSRFHAELRQTATGYEIVDLDTPNGLTVNGQPTKRAALTSGTVIGVGPYTLQFESGAPAVSAPERRPANIPVQGLPPRPLRTPADALPRLPVAPPAPRWSKTQRQVLTFAGVILVVGALGAITYNRPKPAPPPVLPPPSPVAVVATEPQPPSAEDRLARLIAEGREFLGLAVPNLDGAQERVDAALQIDSLNLDAQKLQEEIKRLRGPRTNSVRATSLPATTQPRDPRTDQIEKYYAEAQKALDEERFEDAIKALNNLHSLQKPYLQSEQMLQTAYARLIGKLIDRAQSVTIWSEIERILGQAGQVPQEFQAKLDSARQKLLERNRIEAHKLYVSANSDHTYQKYDLAKEGYLKVMQLLPSTEEDYRYAERDLKTIK